MEQELRPLKESRKELTLDNFHNMIRVFHNIDYIYLKDVLSEEEFGMLRSNPCDFFIRTDDNKAMFIWNAAITRLNGAKNGTNQRD